MLLEYLVDFCDKQYSYFGNGCGCNLGNCNHPSGNCSGSCYDCLYQVHFPSRISTIPKKQYDCTKMLYHYVCQYSYLYTTEVLYALNIERNFIKDYPYYHILSLGCGGCADLMAFDYLKAKGHITAPISYVGIDVNSLWHPIHSAIASYCQHNNIIFNIPGYYDAFKFFENSIIEDANIIIISYLISYLYNTGQINDINKLAYYIANNIVAKKIYGQKLLLIINDVNSNRRGRDYFSYFKDAINNAGLVISKSEYKYFDTGNLNGYQKIGTPHNAKSCCFSIPHHIQNKYHAQMNLNSTVQLILEVI